MADRIQLLGVSQSDAKQAGGKRIKMYWTGDDGIEREMTEFTSADQLVHVMSERDENGRVRYENEAIYRETVKDLLANSGDITGTDGTRTNIGKDHLPTDEQMLKGLHEDAARQSYDWAMEAIGDPDPVIKLRAINWLRDPENKAVVDYVQGVADIDTTHPMKDFLMKHKAETGESFKWSVQTEDPANAINPDEHTNRADSDGAIITVEDK